MQNLQLKIRATATGACWWVSLSSETKPAESETEGPGAPCCFRPIGDLIDCCASRRGRPALPLELVPSFNWYLLVRCGFGLLVLADIGYRLFACVVLRRTIGQCKDVFILPVKAF